MRENLVAVNFSFDTLPTLFAWRKERNGRKKFLIRNLFEGYLTFVSHPNIKLNPVFRGMAWGNIPSRL